MAKVTRYVPDRDKVKQPITDEADAVTLGELPEEKKRAIEREFTEQLTDYKPGYLYHRGKPLMKVESVEVVKPKRKAENDVTTK